MKLIIERRPRVLAFDDEWQYGVGVRKNPLPAFAVVHQPGELAAFLRARLAAPFRVLYQPEYFSEQHLDAVCRLLIATGECTFAIDEVANFVKPSWMPALLSYIVRCGRHPGLSLVWTSQRPADVARRLTGLGSLFVFRLEEAVDLDFVRRRRMPEDKIARLASLPDRHYFAQDARGEWQLFRT